MKSIILTTLLFMLTSLNCFADTCEAGDGKCSVTCSGGCIASYNARTGKCKTMCIPDEELKNMSITKEDDARYDGCIQNCKEEGFTEDYCRDYGCSHLKG